MESAGYREKLILSVSAFMTSTTSWLRMKNKNAIFENWC
jgi:hypothetical protein